MSTYVDKAVNPKTKKTQIAWFIDDYYGQHQYAVAFRKDGGDVVFNADNINLYVYEIYPLTKIKTLNKV